MKLRSVCEVKAMLTSIPATTSTSGEWMQSGGGWRVMEESGAWGVESVLTSIIFTSFICGV